MSDLTSALLALPWLEGMGEGSRQLLTEGVSFRDVQAGQALLMADVWGHAVYLLISGWVKVRGGGNPPKTLAVLATGALVGEMAVLDEVPRSRDVVALTPVQVAMIPATLFQDLVLREAHLGYRLAQELCRRLRQANQRFDLSRQSGAVKLVYTLVQLAEAYGQKTAQGMKLLDLPPEDLADLAGIPVGEAKQALERFSSQGLLRTNPAEQALYLVQYAKLVQAIQMV
ncbi:MAG: Crp/Fnr family transcriptional regulator [Cyanobacteriota bacterium]|nr:Crp/Fnr family transcriptional regulator [Cyanobacteriota bacterium]